MNETDERLEEESANTYDDATISVNESQSIKII